MEDKRREEELAEIKKCRSNMRIIDRGIERRERSKKYEELGICATCIFLHGETRKYGSKRTWCTDLQIKLTPDDPIMDCTNYQESGALPLSLLISMAHPIEVKKEKKVGFIYTDDDLPFDPDDYV